MDLGEQSKRLYTKVVKRVYDRPDPKGAFYITLHLACGCKERKPERRVHKPTTTDMMYCKKCKKGD